jgi:plastocyanin
VNFTHLNLTITVGTTVTWTNQAGGIPHTTTSGTGGLYDGLGWNSPFLNQNETFSHTFSKVGTFVYTCRVHPSMNATVTVTDGSSGGGTPTVTPTGTPTGGYGY